MIWLDWSRQACLWAGTAACILARQNGILRLPEFPFGFRYFH